MNLSLTPATRYGLSILALLGASVALKLGAVIFVPLAIAVFLAAVLWPAAKYLHDRRNVPWFLACASTVGVLVAVNLGLFVAFAAAVPQFLQDLPRPGDQSGLKAFYERIRTQVGKIVPDRIEEIMPRDPEFSGVYQYLERTLTPENLSNLTLRLTGAGMEWLWQGVLILFILLFLLMEGEMLARKVRNVFGPGPDTQLRVTATLAETAEAVRTYLVWRTIVNLCLALILGVVYHAVGLRQATLWALLTAVLAYVPYLGTIAAGLPPVLDAFLYVSPGAALFVFVFYVVLVTVEGYLVVPWVMGRSMDLNATTVIITCLYWDYVWGTAGLFLAMPIMAAIKSALLHVEGWGAWGQLLGSEDEDVHPPDPAVYNTTAYPPTANGDPAPFDPLAKQS